MITCPKDVTVSQLQTISTKYETRSIATRLLVCRPLSCCNAEMNLVLGLGVCQYQDYQEHYVVEIQWGLVELHKKKIEMYNGSEC